MTDPQSVNGAEAPNPMQQAAKRFSKAYSESIAPNGRFQFNPAEVLLNIEMLSVTMDTLVDLCCTAGMDKAAFDQAVINKLNGRAEQLENGPKIQPAPANALRKR